MIYNLKQDEYYLGYIIHFNLKINIIWLLKLIKKVCQKALKHQQIKIQSCNREEKYHLRRYFLLKM